MGEKATRPKADTEPPAGEGRRDPRPPEGGLPGVVRLREQREALTRQTILRAARELFAERGYAATPVRLLARRAGVAPQTIYANYGSKAGVLAAMPDLLDHEAGIPDLFDTRDGTRDPVELLAILAEISRRVLEQCGDIVRTLRTGAADPDVAAAMAEGFRRRRLGVEAILRLVRDEGALREGLTVTRAADTAVALMSDDVCATLVEQSGWSYAEYERWLHASLVALLLAPR